MEDLSKKLQNLKSPVYDEFLTLLSENRPYIDDKKEQHNQIRVVNGRASILDATRHGEKTTIVFPKYGNIQEYIVKKKRQRDELLPHYRYIRNKLYYSNRETTGVEMQYDNVVKELTALDQQIQTMEMYVTAVNNEIQSSLDDLEKNKRELTGNLRSGANTNGNYLRTLKQIDEIGKKMTELQNTFIDFYIKELPVITTATISEPKKRGRPRKQKGGDVVDINKLKKIVKKHIERGKETNQNSFTFRLS